MWNIRLCGVKWPNSFILQSKCTQCVRVFSAVGILQCCQHTEGAQNTVNTKSWGQKLSTVASCHTVSNVKHLAEQLLKRLKELEEERAFNCCSSTWTEWMWNYIWSFDKAYRGEAGGILGHFREAWQEGQIGHMYVYSLTWLCGSCA